MLCIILLEYFVLFQHNMSASLILWSGDQEGTMACKEIHIQQPQKFMWKVCGPGLTFTENWPFKQEWN